MKPIFFLLLLTCGLLLEAAPFPAENSRWTAADLDAQRAAGAGLQRELRQALKTGKKEFRVPKGVYRFAETDPKAAAFFRFLEVKDFTFDGGGSEFYLEKLETAISVYKSENVTIRNLSIDYDPLPFTQGEVVSVDYPNNTFVFRPAPGYGAFCEPMFKLSLRGILFDRADRRMKLGQTGFGLAMKRKLDNGDYLVQVRGFYNRPAQVCGFEPGDLITILGRTARAVKTEVSAGCAFENVTLYSSPFVCFVENVGQGGHTYTNCRIVKRPGTDRLMSGNADGFNSASVLRGPKLLNCEIDTIGDDFVNFHGVYYRVFEQLSPTELVVQSFHFYGDGPAQLSFLESKSWKALGVRSATVGAPFTYTVPEKNSAVGRVWAAAGNFKPGQKVQARRITLDKPLETAAPPIFASLSAIAAGAEIRNCTFRNSLARGIRFQSRDAVIENNLLDRAQSPHLTTAGQPGFWGESITSANLVIRNNTFIEGGMDGQGKTGAAIEITAPGELAAAECVEHIRFENNKILRSGGPAILVRTARDIQLKDNRIDGINQVAVPGRAPAKAAIVVEDSANVTENGNRITPQEAV